MDSLPLSLQRSPWNIFITPKVFSGLLPFLKNVIIGFYFWLCWVFIACELFSSCGKQGLLCYSVQASHCEGSLVSERGALGHTGFSSSSSLALEHGLSNCGTRA